MKYQPVSNGPPDIDEYEKNKNDRFLSMLEKAKEREFKPKFVMFDTMASVKNLKDIRRKQWHFLTRLKSNRLVNPDNKTNRPLETINIPHEEIVIPLKKYGFVEVFRIVSKKEYM